METTPHDVTIAHTVGCSAARHETKNPAEEEARDGSTTVSHVATGTSRRGVLVEKSPHNVTIVHTVGCSASRHETKNPAEEEARDGSATGSNRATGVLRSPDLGIRAVRNLLDPDAGGCSHVEEDASTLTGGHSLSERLQSKKAWPEEEGCTGEGPSPLGKQHKEVVQPEASVGEHNRGGGEVRRFRGAVITTK